MNTDKNTVGAQWHESANLHFKYRQRRRKREQHEQRSKSGLKSAIVVHPLTLCYGATSICLITLFKNWLHPTAYHLLAYAHPFVDHTA